MLTRRAIPSSLPENQNIPAEQTLASGQDTVERSRPAEMARLANALWQQRGCPAGSAEADWLAAEQQLSR
jgi:hypothetical protein